jgi:predicted nucleotidyltransferase component of viral defense system
MPYSKSYLQSLVLANPFIEANVEKVLRLGEILSFLFHDPRLQGKLVLKGGTALNLCYAPLPRLSLDIDLDYIGSVDAATTRRERSEILQLIADVLMRMGYAPSPRSRGYYALSSQVFAYQNAMRNKDVLKIEINFMDRVHLEAIQEKNVILFGKPLKVETLQKEELYGSKIAALIDRHKPRDLYDVNYAIVHHNLGDEDKLKTAIVFYLAMDGLFEFPSSALAGIDSFTYSDIRAELKPVLAKDDDFELDEARSRVKSYLSSLTLSPKEQAFLLSAKRKEFDFSLLSSDSGFIQRMNQHPWVLWKQRS